MSKVKKYNPEFKQEAIQLAMKSGNVNGTAKGLGMPGATLHTWVSQATANKTIMIGDKSQWDAAKLLDDNQRLRKALHRAEQEKSILKKTMGYFAQEQ